MAERIEREVLIDAAPEDVWEAITGAGWLADEVTLDLVPGGDAEFRTRDDVKFGLERLRESHRFLNCPLGRL